MPHRGRVYDEVAILHNVVVLSHKPCNRESGHKYDVIMMPLGEGYDFVTIAA